MNRWELQACTSGTNMNAWHHLLENTSFHYYTLRQVYNTWMKRLWKLRKYTLGIFWQAYTSNKIKTRKTMYFILRKKLGSSAQAHNLWQMWWSSIVLCEPKIQIFSAWLKKRKQTSTSACNWGKTVQFAQLKLLLSCFFFRYCYGVLGLYHEEMGTGEHEVKEHLCFWGAILFHQAFASSWVFVKTLRTSAAKLGGNEFQNHAYFSRLKLPLPETTGFDCLFFGCHTIVPLRRNYTIQYSR